MAGQVVCSYCGVVGYVAERKCLVCGAPLPIVIRNDKVSEVSTNLLGGEMVVQMREICAKYEEIESCYTADTIPDKKLRNARAAFGIAAAEPVILVYDGTVFGNNKLGFAICESGLYWRNDWATPTKRTYLAWDEYKEREIRTKKKELYISLGRGDKIAIVNGGEIKDLRDLLEDIQTLLLENSREE